MSKKRERDKAKKSKGSRKGSSNTRLKTDPRKSRSSSKRSSQSKKQSNAAKKAWRERWERGEGLGPKGKKYVSEFYDIEVPVYEDAQDWDFEVGDEDKYGLATH